MNTSKVKDEALEKLKDAVYAAVLEAIKLCGTQAILAEKSGLTQGAISRYMVKKSLPTGVTANKLSKATGGKLKPSDFAPHIFL